ncbi:ImmA/IrrE family metallo-endopeptidase [Heyndrickxia acidiproducens]|uniref:ImmA/IrrE family metallo-endopeptidase n=1 Tax=Heyndrickxia acidiproducens TaxID=1121084 RepID=UPI000360150F|nr:ImmA/IrrE family metallo-endopeptidase [Heyndrickxia acidiproducens]
MSTYEIFLEEAEREGVEVEEKKMKSENIKGLYGDKTIWINRGLTLVEKSCVLAEEMGHYYTSYGDILDQNTVTNRKQEKQARNWAYEKLISLEKIVQAYDFGATSRFEIADFLNVTEQFLIDAIQHYREKFGLFTRVGKHTIIFDPLVVVKSLNC